MATSLIMVTDTGGTLADHLREFDAFMQVRGWSDRTRHSYRRELVNFVIDWTALRGIACLITVTEAEVHAYIQTLPAQGSKRADTMRALKAFYAWAEGRYRPDDPARALRIPRPTLRPAPELSAEAERALLAAAFRREARRGWAITLCIATGARVSSLVAVRPEDVRLGRDPAIWFRVAKGDRPYGLPLNRPGRVAAAHLIQIGYDPLVGVGAAMFRQWVHAAAQDAGLEIRVWPHLLRHTFATRLARHGDVDAWRRGMNHADLSQWSRYVATSDLRLREALDQRPDLHVDASAARMRP